MSSAKTVRDSNFELLRIIVMAMVIYLHVTQFGVEYYVNVPEYFSPINLFLYHFVRSLAIIAVPTYVLISGYYLASSTFKIGKLIKLFFEVSFISVAVYLLCVMAGYVDFDPSELLYSSLSIFTGEFWFVTVYFVMYAIFPYLNRMLDNLTQKEHFQYLILGFLIINIWQFFYPLEIIGVFRGYSLLNFIYIYSIGNYIRKYGFLFKELNKYAYLAIYILVGAVNGLLIYTTGNVWDVLYAYHSALILTMTYCLFMFFKQITLKSQFINFVASYVFGVYLIHEQSAFGEIIWNEYGIIETILAAPSGLVILAMIGMSIVVFLAVWVASFILTAIYNWLFKWLYKIVTKNSGKTDPPNKPSVP